MKLLNQTQRLFLWAAAPMFVLAGVAMYFALQWAFNHFAEEKLAGVQTEIEAYVRQHDKLPVFFQSIDDRLEAAPIPDGTTFPVNFSDTILYNALEDENEPFRRLSFPVKIRGHSWRVSVIQSALEHEDLAATVAVLLAVLFALLFGVLVWVNRRVSRRVWHPFFSTLNRMRQFRLTDPTALQLDDSSVDEFRELHHTLEELTEKVQRDFRTVKQFTENASHELHTPLAVVQNKVDMLLQDEGLSEQQVQQLDIIRQSARRMAKLNQSLLLLSKIENDQFAERKFIDLKPLLGKRLDWLEDFIADKQLVLHTTLSSSFLEINPFLADTLITNLLTNAVKYNLPGGALKIYLDSRRLTVTNSGEQSEIPISELTERFARGNSRTEGLGLGLAMVKEICVQYGLRFSISFENGSWETVVSFSGKIEVS